MIGISIVGSTLIALAYVIGNTDGRRAARRDFKRGWAELETMAHAEASRQKWIAENFKETGDRKAAAAEWSLK
jgi:hypothetical protein